MPAGLDQLKALPERQSTNITTLLDMSVETMKPGHMVFGPF
jgi:hypothetical protein